VLLHNRDVYLKTLCIVLSVLPLPEAVHGSTISAASGAAPDIQEAVNQAQPGDVVLIPAGQWDFSGTVFAPDGIHIRGAGKDATLLKRNDTASKPFFVVDGGGSNPFRFSDMTLQGVGVERFRAGDLSVLDSGLLIEGKAIDFQVYDARFTGFTEACVKVYGFEGSTPGHARGVIYRNEFVDSIYVDMGVTALGYGVAICGDDEEWELALGSANAVFVEDNYFERCRHAVAANAAARYVFRYNTVVDTYYPYAAVDAHGADERRRGTRSYEVYGNTISGGVHWDTGESTAEHGTWAIGIRGGDGVIFNNQFLSMSDPIFLTIENYANLSGYSYPVPDQTTGLYIWNNRYNGVLYDHVSLGWDEEMAVMLRPFLKEGRDYHYLPTASYRPFIYPHPLRTGLVGRWDFDGNSADSSSYENHGWPIGPVDFVDGPTGEAAEFDGLAAHIIIPDSPSLRVCGDVTIAAWLYPNDIAAGPRGIVSKHRSKEYELVLEPSGAISFYHGDGQWERLYQPASTPVRDARWNHIAVARFANERKVRFYRDGVFVGEAEFARVPTAGSDPVLVGKAQQYVFDGRVDDLRIYNRALSADEIGALVGPGLTVHESAEGTTTSRREVDYEEHSSTSVSPDVL